MNEQVASAEAAIQVEPYEADLVDRAKARSPEAWTEIYTTHYGAIFRYARARVFDETTAEDLASAVFVGALKGIDSYRYRGRPMLAWLYRIARNVVASYQREILTPRGEDLKAGLDLPQRVIWHLMRRPRRDPVHATDQDVIETVGGAGDPAMMVDRFDLRDALAKLPTNQREVVILRFLVGLSAQEVAAVMDKGTAAIYSLQARAILALRERLK
ncbi:MAG: sigma-70 family RNA polymerase sigma factor [Dehalococcoidia bacterium]|nr:sigma-70 family RNA polymerase sigma factor [Dehalococcoidia bacterium]